MLTIYTLAFYVIFYHLFKYIFLQRLPPSLTIEKIRAYQVPNETQFYEYLGLVLYPDRSMFNCIE